MYFCKCSGTEFSSPFDLSHDRENSRLWYRCAPSHRIVATRLPEEMNQQWRAEQGRAELTRTKLLCHLHGGYDVKTRAGAKVETGCIEQLVKHHQTLLVGNVERTRDLVYKGAKVLRDTALADTCPLH
jgi:hypothetical protein